MIRLYSAKITDFKRADYTKMYSLLDCAMKQKIDAKSKNDDKMRSLAGYILFLRGAKEIYNKTDFNITLSKEGKPFCDFCFFSISHSEDRVVCVLSDTLIGVDIQKIHLIKPRKKYKFFNQKENYYVNQDRELISERYIEIFTKKEAALKMKGFTLHKAASIDTFSNKFCFETKTENGFVLTYCTENM